MARLNDEGQWIILMSFIICVTIFFLALVVNESILVGQTTAEGVLEFSKSDIQDLRNEILRVTEVQCPDGMCNVADRDSILQDIKEISLQRKNSLVVISIDPTANLNYLKIQLNYNNGVTEYHETMYTD